MSQNARTHPGFPARPAVAPSAGTLFAKSEEKPKPSAVAGVGRPLEHYRVTDRAQKSGPNAQESAVEPPDQECPTPISFTRTRINTGTGEVQDDTVEKECCRWSCPACGPKMRRRYVGHFCRVFAELPALHFLTLTLDPKGLDDPRKSRKYLYHCWTKYRKRMARRARSVGAEFRFCGTFEQHKSGIYHLHILTSAPLEEEVIRSQWFKSGGGIVLDCQSLDETSETSRLIGYIMKYALKDASTQAGHQSRRSLICSQGDGYYSKAHKAARQAFARHMGGRGEEDADDIVEEWYPDQTGSPGARVAEITDAEREMFDEWAERAKRSTLYIHDDGSKRTLHYWDGEDVRSRPIPPDATREQVKALIRWARKQQRTS